MMTTRTLVQEAVANSEQQESTADILQMLRMYRASRKLTTKQLERQTAKIDGYIAELEARGVEVPEED